MAKASGKLPERESNDGNDPPSDRCVIQGGARDWVNVGHHCYAADEQEVQHSKEVDGSAGRAQINGAFHKLAAACESFEGEGYYVCSTTSFRQGKCKTASQLCFLKALLSSFEGMLSLLGSRSSSFPLLPPSQA